MVSVIAQPRIMLVRRSLAASGWRAKEELVSPLTADMNDETNVTGALPTAEFYGTFSLKLLL